ncbi:MAG: CRISPR-associated helicase/endonuclease Cas3, partial [Nitrososphaerales archaeon]
MRKVQPEVEEILRELLSNRRNIGNVSFPDDTQLARMREEISSLRVGLLVDDFRTNLKRLRNEPDHALETYFLFLLMYSILLFSDRRDVTEVEAGRHDIPPSLVDSYLNSMQNGGSPSRMNELRKQVYDSAVEKAKELNLDQRIYSINVPTGSGKTLTSVGFALRLRERINSELGYTPRIIYSLPFITIIEQNYEVLKKVLLPISGAGGKVPSELLLAHHHLSGVKFSTANNEYDINESEFLIESWSSEIVVTTFVQFFYSIISDNRGMSVKFHNIVNSIVILDEIQSLPYDLWELVRFAILFLANAFHTYFIFTTATLPMLLRENEIEEAVDHKELIYKRLHRVELLY